MINSLGGLRYEINSHLPKGTAWRVNKGMPNEYLIADSVETVKSLVDKMNELVKNAKPTT